MNPLIALKNYFASAKIELEKVAWPSQEQTIRYSVAIIVASLVAALSFTAIDSALHAGVTKLISLRAPAAVVTGDQDQTVTPDFTVTTTTSPSVTTQVTSSTTSPAPSPTK